MKRTKTAPPITEWEQLGITSRTLTNWRNRPGWPSKGTIAQKSRFIADGRAAADEARTESRWAKLSPEMRQERARKIRAERLLVEARLRRMNRDFIPLEDVVELYGIITRVMLDSFPRLEERCAHVLREYPAALAELKNAQATIIPDTKAAFAAALERVKACAADAADYAY